MTNIESKLEAKRKELTAANEEQSRLWDAYLEADGIRSKRMVDWGVSSAKQKTIQREIDILEGVLNEMASA